MIEFAYLTFVNNNIQYIELLKSTVKSVKVFSKHKLIIYFVNTPQKISQQFEDEQIIIRHIDINLPNIYYYKPYVIIDAIKNGLLHGYYIESEDLLTPHADDYLYEQSLLLYKFPISPIHPDDPQIPVIDMLTVNSLKKTQHYVHAHVLFSETCLTFIEEWLDNCLKYDNYRNADETVLNLMYWKYNCVKHYLDVIDPWYENFYTDIKTRDLACTFHGCKDPVVQMKLFEDMVLFYKLEFSFTT